MLESSISYENTKVYGKANIAPEEYQERINLIRKARDLIDNGYSVTEALRIVTMQGLVNRNGKTIGLQHFSKMLRQKVYMGTIEAFGLTIDSQYIDLIIEKPL